MSLPINDMPEYIERLLTCFISLHGAEEVINGGVDAGILTEELVQHSAVIIFTLRQLEKAIEKQIIDCAAYIDVDLDELVNKIKEENKL